MPPPSECLEEDCALVGQDRGECTCLAGLPPGTADDSKVLVCVMLFCRLFAQGPQRNRSLMYLGHLIAEVTKIAESNFDATEHNTDGTKLRQQLAGEKRSLRVDDGVKASVFSAVQSGRGSNPAQLLRAMDNSLYKGAHHWTKERLLEEIVKGRLTLWPVGTYCIVPDGKRLSNPGLDIVVCWLWHEPSGSAMWAPPQVPQGG